MRSLRLRVALNQLGVPTQVPDWALLHRPEVGESHATTIPRIAFLRLCRHESEDAQGSEAGGERCRVRCRRAHFQDPAGRVGARRQCPSATSITTLRMHNCRQGPRPCDAGRSQQMHNSAVWRCRSTRTRCTASLTMVSCQWTERNRCTRCLTQGVESALRSPDDERSNPRGPDMANVVPSHDGTNLAGTE